MKKILLQLAIFCSLLSATTSKAQTITTYLSTLPGIAADAADNVYVRDSTIRKISPGGGTTVIAGTGTAGFSGDGGPATAAQIAWSGGLVLDGVGNIYISDNNRIRKISTAGVITTVAGNGTYAFTADGASAATAAFKSPAVVAADAAGNFYIVESDWYAIRKVNAAGIISTVVGNGTFGNTGDGGPATAATVGFIGGMAIDAAGNLFFSDNLYHVIRKVNTAGVISKVAGTATWGFGGDGGPALAATIDPHGIAMDAAGNIFIADGDNNRVRKINTAGTISTIAGTGTWGFSGDGGPATAAMLAVPFGVAVDGSGNIYIRDVENHRIRKVSPTTAGMAHPDLIVNEIAVYPNPSNGTFTLTGHLSDQNEQATITMMNMLGAVVYKTSAAIDGVVNKEINTDLADGTYILQIQTGTASVNQPIVIKH